MVGTAASATVSDTISPDSVDWEMPSIVGDKNREFEFIDRWNELLENANRISSSLDVDERLNHTLINDAWEIAGEHPEFITVDIRRRENVEDMNGHILDHFSNLFNNRNMISTELIPNPANPNTKYLFRAAELVYLHDSITRFSERTRFEPDIGPFGVLDINILPDEIGPWLEGIEVMWLVATGNLKLESDDHSLIDMIDDLYERREEMVERAKDHDMFLLIAPEKLPGEIENIELPKVSRKMLRNEDIDPHVIHSYCFANSIHIA